MNDNVLPNRKPSRDATPFCRDKELEQDVRESIEENYRDLTLLSPSPGEAILRQPEALAAGVADAVAELEFLQLMFVLQVFLCLIDGSPPVKRETERKKEQV